MEHSPKGSETVDVVIIGAGPSGLTAALELQRSGRAPLLLEKGDQVGGLMRSPRWGDVVLDLGRKELYARFTEIDKLWNGILGADFAEYPHRVGSLYRGRIIEMSGRYRGVTRGMPPWWLIRGGAGLLRGWVAGAARRPRTMAEFWQSRVGAEFARILAQGYWEKFRGTTWAEMPAPEHDLTGGSRGPGVLSGARQALRMARRGGVAAQKAWRHPLRGTGQLFEAIADAYTEQGGKLRFGAEVTELRPAPDGTMQVCWRDGGQEHCCHARHVVSSLQVEQLWALLSGDAADDAPVPGPEATRAVLLVYLIFASPPPFPHAWLEVNDPDLKCGRVTNYAAFGGGMVPDGHSALCVEYFCDGADPLLGMSRDAQVAFALSEMSAAGLIGPEAPIGSKVINLPRTNAAASWREQQSSHRATLFERIKAFPAVYHVNRPGSDWASLAGLQAARAILNDDRRTFDEEADPTRRQEESASSA